MSQNPLLQIKSLVKAYQSGNITVQALKGINLTIERGEIVSLLGPNGAGKTTLSTIIATLHPYTSGQVLFEGQSIYDNIGAYRTRIGYCPQYNNLDGELNVRDNLLFYGRYFALEENVLHERVDTILNRFNLTSYANFMVSALSGGYRQRVLIARAMLNDPQIVILDEPTVALDPHIRRAIWQIIKQLKADGITVLLTTHYLDEAEILSDRVCILNKGEIMLIETPTKLKQQHNQSSLEDVFVQLMHEEA